MRPPTPLSIVGGRRHAVGRASARQACVGKQVAHQSAVIGVLSVARKAAAQEAGCTVSVRAVRPLPSGSAVQPAHCPARVIRSLHRLHRRRPMKRKPMIMSPCQSPAAPVSALPWADHQGCGRSHHAANLKTASSLAAAVKTHGCSTRLTTDRGSPRRCLGAHPRMHSRQALSTSHHEHE